MEQKYFRHGDVLIRRLDENEEVKGDKQEKLVLAEGEVTGHSHRITKGEAALFKFDDKMYLKVTSERAALAHEEHKPIELLRGDYEIKIQREYEPGGWKKVQD